MPSSEDVFRAIADATRREILSTLGEGDQSVRALSDLFEMTPAAVSQHLKVLREVGLVHAKKDGRLRIYQLDAAGLKTVFEWISHFESFWDVKLDGLEAHLKRRSSTKAKRKKR